VQLAAFSHKGLSKTKADQKLDRCSSMILCSGEVDEDY